MSRDRQGIRRLGETKVLESDPRSKGPKRKRRPKPLAPAPPRPEWLTPGTYDRLLELREQL